MTPQDIEASLSYAYLHAVASHTGVACQEANRAHDNLGIDASLNTIYLPMSQALSPTGLTDLLRRVAHQEELRYGT